MLSWVFEHSEATGSDRLVLLGLADYAHDDGTKAYPAVENLAKKARTKKRATQYALKRLQEGGHIERTHTLADGRNVYRVIMEKKRGGAKSAPVHERSGGVQPDAPNPSIEPSKGVGTRAREAKLKISAKPVQAEAWDKTMMILESFNAATGKQLGLLTGTGQPSETARRIYLRVLDWPELTVEQHRDIINRTLESRWWGDDAPGVGVVYGPRVFEENMTRQPSGKQSKKDARAERRAKDLAAIKALVEEREQGE